MGEKRKRLALSCVDCRKRKVKCDRTYPWCLRCQRGGYGDKCTYVSDTSKAPEEGVLSHSDVDERNVRARRDQSWMAEAEERRETAASNEAVARERGNTDSMSGALPRIALNRPTFGTHAGHTPLQDRVTDLETYVYSTGGRPFNIESNMGTGLLDASGVGQRRNASSGRRMLAEEEKALLRGKSFKTQYFGPSHDLAILLQFEDLSKFVKDILLAIPSLSNSKATMLRLRKKEKDAEKATYDVSVEALTTLVPEKQRADALLHEYLDSIETTYRVLHVPTFMHDYEKYWQSPKEARADFLITLLLVMSTMNCVVPGDEPGFVGRSSARREQAAHWCYVAQQWTDRQSRKHITLAVYQINILLWLSKRMNCIKMKREWTFIGDILRQFMSAGLHREPALLSNKISVFDCEMRRRLWYTTLELDLQSSLYRGMTPTLGPNDWDAEPPRNIDDDSFNIDTERLPESKSRGVFTRTSFLAWTSESLPFRIELLYKINSLRNTMDMETVLRQDQQIRLLMDGAPITAWSHSSKTEIIVNGHSTPATQSTPTPANGLPYSTAVAVALCQLILHEYTIILHQPFASSTFSASQSRHFLSRSARREAYTQCLSVYSTALKSNSANPNAISALQRRVLANLRDDHVRAALCLAHDLAMSTQTPNPLSSMLSSNNTSQGLDLLADEVNLLDDRIRNIGQGFHCYWITSSAYSFVHSKQNPDVPRQTFARAAADRVVKLHDFVLQAQLPRARRMMLPGHVDAGPGQNSPEAEEKDDERTRAKSARRAARTEKNRQTVNQISSVDGTSGLQSSHASVLTPQSLGTDISSNSGLQALGLAAQNAAPIDGEGRIPSAIMMSSPINTNLGHNITDVGAGSAMYIPTSSLEGIDLSTVDVDSFGDSIWGIDSFDWGFLMGDGGQGWMS